MYRLSTPLRLPRLKGRPPCAPRVYKKLLGFLEQVLAPLPKSTPTRDLEKSSVTKSRKSPSTPTPTRVGRRDGDAGAETPTRKRGFSGKISNSRTVDGLARDAPEFVMPLIRQLCAAFSVKALAPHIYTGVCTVLKLAKIDIGKEDAHQVVSILTIALFFMVLAKARDSDIDPETYVAESERALSIAGLDTNTMDQLDEWIEQISENDWGEGQEWWQNIPASALPAEADIVDGSNEEDEDVVASAQKKRRFIYEDEDKEGVLLPGLGTMLQEQNDLLSEERRQNFGKWKTGIMGRIVKLEKEQQKVVRAL